MSIPERLLEVSEYGGDGYQPVVDYETWRVAILNYTPDFLPEKIDVLTAHDDTDEVFVLLEGKCLLFLAEGNDEDKHIYAVDMKPGRVYNVKKGIWHTHTFSRKAKLLIIENSNTSEQNSPEVPLSGKNRDEIMSLVQQYRG